MAYTQMSQPSLSADEFDELVDAAAVQFPAAFLKKGRAVSVPLSEVCYGIEPLTAEDVRTITSHIESGAPNGSDERPDVAIRLSHHRAAQYVAQGLPDVEVAAITGYTPQYIYILKSSPAFQQLMAHYAGEVAEVWRDHVGMANVVATDLLEEIQARLATKPETITNSQLTETYKAVADRGGLAPTQKSLNMNINADMGDRMLAARERLRKVSGD